MRQAAALAACGLLAACAGGTSDLTPETAPAGYLQPGHIEALSSATGRWRDDGDIAASQALRTFEDGDRWWLAMAHAELRPPYAAQHFDCGLGTRLSARPRPALTRVMARLLVDSATVADRLATAQPRPRPIAADASRRACQRLTEAQKSSGSWPATAAVAGAAYGELFAMLAPDRAEAIRAIGHEIGVSRAVCAMNWPSDVEDGQRLGLAVYEQAAASEGFTADLEAARADVVAARAEGLTSPACAAERRALGVRPGAG